jgi:hypothetical protein
MAQTPAAVRSRYLGIVMAAGSKSRVTELKLSRLESLVRIATHGLNVTWAPLPNYARAVDLARVEAEHTLAVADALRVCFIADTKRTAASDEVVFHLSLTKEGVLLYLTRPLNPHTSGFAREIPLMRRWAWRLANKHL